MKNQLAFALQLTVYTVNFTATVHNLQNLMHCREKQRSEGRAVDLRLLGRRQLFGRVEHSLPGLAFLRMAARMGDDESLILLARYMVHRGYRLLKQRGRTLTWIKRAAIVTRNPEMLRLFAEFITTRNEDFIYGSQWRSILMRSADAGDFQSQFILACQMRWHATDLNDSALFRQSYASLVGLAEFGFGPAIAELGCCLANDGQCDVGLSLLVSVLNRGYLVALNNLVYDCRVPLQSIRCEEGSFEELMRGHLDLALRGQISCAFQLREWFLSGFPLPRDLVLAIRLVRRSLGRPPDYPAGVLFGEHLWVYRPSPRYVFARVFMGNPGLSRCPPFRFVIDPLGPEDS